mgnify:CR=1 FL=1
MNIDSDFKSFRVRGISPEGIRHLRHYWRNGPQNRMFIYSEEEWDGKIKREMKRWLIYLSRRAGGTEQQSG